jgi:1-pyrroline-5-carboxylate dehydrogenase
VRRGGGCDESGRYARDGDGAKRELGVGFEVLRSLLPSREGVALQSAFGTGKESIVVSPSQEVMARKTACATSDEEELADFHAAYDRALGLVKKSLGRHHPMFIDGQSLWTKEEIVDRSPIDTRLQVGFFAKGTADHVQDAVIAARRALPEWSNRPWEERIAVLRNVAQALRAHRFELAAAIAYDAGKNRLECAREVEESAEFVDYYCGQMEQNRGFVQGMESPGEGGSSCSKLRPYGVWSVIAPFNFPLMFAAGPSAAALIAGNSVVFKPASDTPFVGLKLYEMFVEGGVPRGVFNLIIGSGSVVGLEMVENGGIDGIVFAGSKEVGMHLARSNALRSTPRPVITEMGGKNPTVVMTSAHLEMAAEGVFRSAFGAQGQKCSACSRVYVAREVRDRFLELLVAKTASVRIGPPVERDVWLGPVINENAVKTYERAIRQAVEDGGRILIGGHRLTKDPLCHGFYVEPTVIDHLPNTHLLFSEELFVPLVVVGEVGSLTEAIELANRTEYGLTAGIFSEDPHEIDSFFDHVEAGVVYANRSAGITTGAWPGVNPFGGWKASGSSGRGSGGPYYLQQFMREQSQVRAS